MEESLESIKGVGPGRAKQLHKLGISNVSSLLTYFPRAYEDRRTVHPMGTLKPGIVGSVVGTVMSVQEKRPRPRLSILEILIQDGTGRLKLVLFNQGYKKNFYKVGQRLHAYGKVELAYGSLQMNSPQTENLSGDVEPDRGVVPVYPLVDGVSQFVVRQAVRNWFDANTQLDSILPASLEKKKGLMSRYDAFKHMHFPTSLEAYEASRHQLAYEELFVMQMGLLLLREQTKQAQAPYMGGENRLVRQCVESLPFQLTSDQQRAWQDIASDMESHKPMQRLLQGDVGAGKTIVAVLALLKAVENGYQGALMAPTEILAAQHYEGVRDLCESMNLRIELLVGSVKAKEKRRIYEELEAGDIDIVIGTHALIQEGVHFHRLGVVIIDEQHRFGVDQRVRLQEKGMHPHVLIMTATPIPRTMTLSMYGDLEVSLIKEMPPGRKPVKTYVVDSSYTERLRKFFQKEMEGGHQVYVVCPLVEESETLDLQAAEALYSELLAYFHKTFIVGLVHGRMTPSEKDEVMDAFYRGDVQLLVSTTVIEVGVNVPNATIMCIEGAERFGLSQLHQLRGRVGRSDIQSYCVLISDSKNPDSVERLKLMERIYDGFQLAEEDLLIRGSGQLFGTMQSGMADLKVAHIIKDVEIMIEARQDAKDYLEAHGVDDVVRHMERELRHRFGNRVERILQG